MKKTLIINITTIIIVIFIITIIPNKVHSIRTIQYELLQKSTEYNNLTLTKALLFTGAPPSPYEQIYELSYFSALTDTPIQIAANNGNAKMVSLLIKYNASVDWCCCSCVTALHYGIMSKNTEVVKLLLEAGADTQIQYDLKLSCLELAKEKSTKEIVMLLKEYEE